MPNFKEFIKGFEEKPAPQKSQRDLDTEEHNKIVAQINAKAPKMKHEDYKAEIAKEDARFNSVQDKWEDEPKPQPKENRDQIIEKVNQKMMNANTYGELGDKENYEKSIAEAEELRKGLATNPQPKQGSFEQAFNDMSKPEQDLGDFNPSERIEDYQSGAKTNSENEFRLEALNDRGMYDFISKNRDYLYRKANSDPEGAIKDIIRHGQNNYGIKPQNIRKDYAMEVLKSFYEDDEGAIPDFTKQEEFKPSEQIEEFNDYYGAKTNSERNLNLLTGNDRGAYEYVTQNRDALAKEAEYDPASVLNKIKWHASDRNFARDLKGDSIRKDYLINVIKGIVED